jgi:DNA (cytosine-5)-methyltransferase 1
MQGAGGASEAIAERIFGAWREDEQPGISKYMKQLRVLDVFSGGGGSSSGARAAGARIVGAIDAWDLATETFKENFPNAHVVTKTLEKVALRQLRQRIGPIDVLLASPECTNHTPAKGSAKRCEASRQTAFQVARFAKAFKPRWIIVENVLQMKSWSGYKKFIDGLEDLGYHIRAQVLNARDFGAAQTRRRLFVSCDLMEMPPEILPNKKRKVKTVAEILDPAGTWKMTPVFTEKRASNTIVRYLTGLNRIGPNKSFLLVYYGSDGAGGWQSLDRPLRTITTVDRFALVDQSGKEPTMRMLQVSELQRAMGFSDNYKLNGASRRDRIKIVGNAVCPPMMEAIVKKLTQKHKVAILNNGPAEASQLKKCTAKSTNNRKKV